MSNARHQLHQTTARIFQRLRVFVSSSMEELQPERAAVREALSELNMEAWVFENDAGARPRSITQTFLEEIDLADLYLGIFWKKYGEYSIQEFKHARLAGKDCLIYEKRSEIEQACDPRLHLFLEQLSDVEHGLTVRWFDTLDELKRLVTDDVAAWQAEIVRQRQITTVSPGRVDTEDRRNLLSLLEKVKQFWIEGVLQASAHGLDLISLNVKIQPGEVSHPWAGVVELPDQTRQTLRPGQSIEEIFERHGKALLILGEPGSGKTTMLLELARERISRAEKNPLEPVPVVFNLSSWDDAIVDLSVWLTQELSTKYQIPTKIGRIWLTEHRILPLLDGLDETSDTQRPGCLRAINQFVDEYGLSGLAVCSRSAEYKSLPTRLRLNVAISLHPLAKQQIDEYLVRAGSRLASLRLILQDDPALQQLATSPLMLSVMSLAYSNLPVEEFNGVELVSVEARRDHLFETYIERMFERSGMPNPKSEANKEPRITSPTYTAAKVRAWVGWLARGMRRHMQSVFLIERLQPSWLSTRIEHWLYLLITRLLFGFFMGLITLLLAQIDVMAGSFLGNDSVFHIGVFEVELLFIMTAIVATLSAYIGALTLRRAQQPAPSLMPGKRRWNLGMMIAYIVGGGAVYTMIYQLISRSSEFSDLLSDFGYGAIYMVIPAIFVFARQAQSGAEDIRTVEALNWTWRGAINGTGTGLRVAISLGLFIGLLTGIVLESEYYSHSMAHFFAGALNIERGWVLGFAVWAMVSLGGVPIGAVFGGLEPHTINMKIKPNQGIRLSLKNMVFAVAAAGVPLILIMGAVQWQLYDINIVGSADWFSLWLYIGLVIVIIVALWYGALDAIHHYVLVFLLKRAGHIPWRHVHFLDYAAKLILLRKVGGGYIFLHRLLLEHFCAVSSRPNRM